MSYEWKGKGCILLNNKLYGDIDSEVCPESIKGGKEIPENLISNEMAEALGKKLVKFVKPKTAKQDKAEKGKGK